MLISLISVACGGGTTDQADPATTADETTATLEAETTATMEAETTVAAAGLDPALLDALVFPSRAFIGVDEQCRSNDSQQQLDCETKVNQPVVGLALDDIEKAAAAASAAARQLPEGTECADLLDAYPEAFTLHFRIENPFLERNIKAKQTPDAADDMQALTEFYVALRNEGAYDAPTVLARVLSACRAIGDPTAPSAVLQAELTEFFSWSSVINNGLGVQQGIVGYCLLDQKLQADVPKCIRDFLQIDTLPSFRDGQNGSYQRLTTDPSYAQLPQACRDLVDKDLASGEAGIAAMEKIADASADGGSMTTTYKNEWYIEAWAPANQAGVHYWTKRDGILECMEKAAAVT
jgi:hypothetical protein